MRTSYNCLLFAHRFIKFTIMRIFTIFCLFFVVSQVYGRNFRPGFIITNEQDTISGWIDFRSDARNMAVCNFKLCENCEVTTFLPGEIFGYRFYNEGKFYVSREIVIRGEPRTVFLEFMVQGMMNLFYYVDTSSALGEVEYFFFEDQSGRMFPISRRPDERITGTTIHQDLRFRPAIRSLFREHESIVNQADRLEFSQRAMIDIARQYHDLTCPIGEECIVFANPHPDREFLRISFSVYGGAALGFAHHFSNRSLVETSPMIGGRMNIYAPRIDRNLSVQIDLGFFADSIFYILPMKIGAKYAFLGNSRLRPTVGVGSSIIAGFEKTGTGTEFHIAPFFLYASAGVEFQLNRRNILFFDAEIHRNAFSFANFLEWDFSYLMLKAGIRF